MKQDLTIPVGNISYNARVSIIVKCGDDYIVDLSERSDGTEDGNPKFSFIGGRIKFGETITEAATREAKEELGLKKIRDLKFVGVGEATWFSKHWDKKVHEHNYIFILELGELPPGSDEIDMFVIKRSQMHMFPIVPTYLIDVALNEPKEFAQFFDEEVSIPTTDIDICFGNNDTPPLEYNVRTSAIIIQDGAILVDEMGKSVENTVLIGGRLKLGEWSNKGLERELKEELSIEGAKYTFLGIGENEYEFVWKEVRKRVHMVQYFYEVDITDCEIIPTDEAIFAKMQVEDFLSSRFKMSIAKKFVKKVIENK